MEELPTGPPEWLPYLTDSSSDEEEESDEEEATNSRVTTHCSQETSDYSRENSGTDNSRENSVDPPEFVLTVTLLPSLPVVMSPPPIPSSPVIEFFPAEAEPDVPLTPTQSR